MARIRSIKPEFPHDEKLGECSRDARLLFVLLWTLCDDHGRFRAAPTFIRTSLFPYDLDVTPKAATGWLDELAAKRRIQLYEHNGESYGVVLNWVKHQRIDNAGKPMYPDPPQLSANCGELERNAAGVDQDLSSQSEETEPKKQRKRQIPDSWHPTEKHYADHPSIDVDHEAEAFRDHAIANSRTLADWDAGFRNWLRKAIEFGAKPAKAVEQTQPAHIERNQRRARGEACGRCGDVGWVEDESGVAHVCDHRESA